MYIHYCTCILTLLWCSGFDCDFGHVIILGATVQFLLVRKFLPLSESCDLSFSLSPVDSPAVLWISVHRIPTGLDCDRVPVLSSFKNLYVIPYKQIRIEVHWSRQESLRIHRNPVESSGFMWGAVKTSKIVWAMSYMKSGHTNHWATCKFKHEAKSGHLHFINWPDSKDEFWKDFMPLNSKAVAVNVLETTTYFQDKQTLQKVPWA